VEVDLCRLLGKAAAGPDRQRLTVDDEQAILDAVPVVLGPSGLVDAGTGLLRSCSELARNLDHTLLPDYRVESSIKRARVLRADATTATVDLDAAIETVATGDREVRTRTRAQGPVQLVREGEAWKVGDLVVDGVSLRSSFFQNGVTGSVGGLTVSVLGGRAFPTRVWVYLELSNELERPVKVESVAIGQRRSLLPGWRWARGRIAVNTVPPGSVRVDAIAALQDVHAAAGIRLLLRTDAGFVDARPQSVRSRRHVPLSVRYPWVWSSGVVTALIVALGSLFGWWIAGLALVQIAGVTLFSFEGHLRRGVGRPTLIRFAWTLTGLAAGAALLFANGGFGRFRGDSDHHRVTSYVEGVTGAGVVDAKKVAESEVGACDYRIWDVRTTKRRWWVMSVKGRRTGLPITLYGHSEFGSAAKLIAYRLELNRRAVADLEKMLGKRAKSLPPLC